MTKKQFVSDNDTVFEPWSRYPMVGFKVTHKDGRVTYVYFNPSGSTDDDTDNVFVYVGPNGEPGDDESIVYVEV